MGSGGGGGTSTFVIKWINFLTTLIALGVIGFGIWMSSHTDGCRKSLTLPVLALGAIILIINWISGGMEEQLHLVMDLFDTFMFDPCGNIDLHRIGVVLSLIRSRVFLVYGFCLWTGFIVTNNGSGHRVAGLRYKEYQLQDYSSWFLKELNNSHNWKNLKACLVKSKDCANLSKKYKTLKKYKAAKLTPIEAGCCRPPSECEYPAVNASYYDLSYHPASSNKDCKLYKNSKTIKCYNCDSCKAGVAQYMKTEWRVVAVFNVALFFVLSIVYFVGCCARRNAASSWSKG